MVLGPIISLFLALSFSVAHAQILSGIIQIQPNPATPPPTVTYVTGCGADGGNAPVPSASCFINGITGGDLLLACVTNYTGSTITVSDGTSTFTGGTQSAGPNVYARCFYLLSANGGNKNFTASATPDAAGIILFVQQFHASSGTWHFDTWNQASANGTALATGNITTAHSTGEAILFSTALANVGATQSSISIGGHAPTEVTGSPQNTFQHAFYLLNTGVTAGQGSLTYSTATDWGAGIIAAYAQ